MSNNKQNSVEWLFCQLIDKEYKNPHDTELILILEQAKAMHKEECIKYYVDSTDYGDMGQHIRESLIQIAEKIYNKTFEE